MFNFKPALLLTTIALFCFVAMQCNHKTYEHVHTNKKPMNLLASLHDANQAVSPKMLFKSAVGETRTLQILKDGLLREHVTQTEAILICVSGEVLYEDENKTTQILFSGDFVRIEPMVKHWVKGIQDSQLLLIK